MTTTAKAGSGHVALSPVYGGQVASFPLRLAPGQRRRGPACRHYAVTRQSHSHKDIVHSLPDMLYALGYTPSRAARQTHPQIAGNALTQSSLTGENVCPAPDSLLQVHSHRENRAAPSRAEPCGARAPAGPQRRCPNAPHRLLEAYGLKILNNIKLHKCVNTSINS